MPQTSQLVLTLGKQGRLVIPADLRRKLSLEPGEKLVTRVEDGRLVLETAANVRRRLCDRFANVPRDISLANELIEERRREARLESP